MPRIIGVTAVTGSGGNYATFKTGSEAASALMTSASFSVRHLAVPASASISYSIGKTYRREDQWAMYNLNADTYLASLRDYNGRLAETALVKSLEDAVPVGEGSNKEAIQYWKDFFASWGTHVISKSAFGARFQLVRWLINPRVSSSLTFYYR